MKRGSKLPNRPSRYLVYALAAVAGTAALLVGGTTLTTPSDAATHHHHTRVPTDGKTITGWPRHGHR
jgi:hypothetical protein